MKGLLKNSKRLLFELVMGAEIIEDTNGFTVKDTDGNIYHPDRRLIKALIELNYIQLLSVGEVNKYEISKKGTRYLVNGS